MSSNLHVLLTKVGKCIEMCHSRKDSGGSMLPGLAMQLLRAAILTPLVTHSLDPGTNLPLPERDGRAKKCAVV